MHMKANPFLRRAAQLVAAVCAGWAAHRMGVCHLDVKPENILIDTAGRAKLIDFGIARLRGAWQEEVYAEGVVSGTPAYMPPEQAQGRTQELSPRSDVFSLAAVLYFLLVGHPPYRGESQNECLEKAAKWEWDEAALWSAPGPRARKRSAEGRSRATRRTVTPTATPSRRRWSRRCG